MHGLKLWDTIHLLEAPLPCKTAQEPARLGDLASFKDLCYHSQRGTLKRTFNYESGDRSKDSRTTANRLCGHSHIYGHAPTPALSKGSPNMWLRLVCDDCFSVISYVQAAADESRSDGQASLAFILKKQ